MNEDKDEIEFSYEVFDRQLDNFYQNAQHSGRCMGRLQSAGTYLRYSFALHQSHPALLYGRERYGAAAQRHSETAKELYLNPERDVLKP